VIPFTGLKRQYNNLRQQILSATDRVFASGQLMNGTYTAEFETWLAKKNHFSHAITCHSGTSALEILARYYAQTLPAESRPRVIIPTLTYMATANAFIQAGWEVVFVDTDRYGLMDFGKIPDMSYQAIVLVGLYGSSVSTIASFRQLYGWEIADTIVIEDAAQHWLSSDCRRISESAAISFDPMKNLPCYGNGGAVVTSSDKINDFARSYRDNGKPSYQDTGSNSRMSELDCALMMIKVQHLDGWQSRRQQIAKYYCERLTQAGITTLIDDTNDLFHSYHKFVIEIDSRDLVQQKLLERGIETKIHYDRPLHEIGIYRRYQGPGIFSCASSLARRVLSLPIYPELTDNEVERITNQVIDCVSQTHN
jgi:dTDP-4-amino-4,6-dideoxygalactose transaminase